MTPSKDYYEKIIEEYRVLLQEQTILLSKFCRKAIDLEAENIKLRDSLEKENTEQVYKPEIPFWD